MTPRSWLPIGAWLALALVCAAANALISLGSAQLAEPIVVRVHLASPPSRAVQVLRVTPRGSTQPLASEGGAWHLATGYATRLVCRIAAADAPALDSLELVIGSTPHAYTRPELERGWHPVTDGSEVVLTSPRELEVPSRLGARLGFQVINRPGDADLLRWFAVSVVWMLVVFAIAVRLAFRGWPTRLPRAHPWLERALFCGALALPPLLALLTRSCHTDVQVFFSWGEAWAAWPRRIYLASRATYPWLGTFATAFPAATFARMAPDAELAIRWFRLYVSLLDLTTTLLLAVLIRLFVRERALLWASLIALAPSSWAGGALWGQIDSLGQSEILLTMIVAIQASRLARARPSAAMACYALACTGLAAMLLTKQHLLAAILALGLFLLVLAARIPREVGWRRALPLALLVAIPLLAVLACDRLVEVPRGYVSHLAFVYLFRGSRHTGFISANGFNLWTFLGPGRKSSMAPFTQLLNPHATGPVLLALFWGLLAASRRRGFADLGRAIGAPPEDARAEARAFGIMLLLFALLQLSLNVLMAATQERFLIYCYPYLILGAVLVARSGTAIPVRTQVLMTCGAVVYGLFVLSILHPLPGALFLASSVPFVAALHLALLVDVSALVRRLLAAPTIVAPAIVPPALA